MILIKKMIFIQFVIIFLLVLHLSVKVIIQEHVYVSLTSPAYFHRVIDTKMEVQEACLTHQWKAK